LRLHYGKPDIRMLRKSRPFWSYLSDYGIFNSIIRVPITFPPEKLRGVQLSAMCVPDLRGTQGTFSHYTTQRPDDVERTGGEVLYVERQGTQIRSHLIGPPDPRDQQGGSLKLPFVVTIKNSAHAVLKIGGETHTLKLGEYTDWITVRFKVGLSSAAQGVCRFLLLSTEPEFSLYVTPINIDPEKPAMAIGYPKVYPIYLSKRQGPYATLGLAEDTWGLSEQVLEDKHFLQQCIDIDHEREEMFFDSLEKVPEGLCVCVFDGTDRMQHMFWRYHDQHHPARPAEIPEGLDNAIEDLYIRMDDLVGRTMRKCNNEQTLLMVLSDHGFNTFRRCVDLNCWLEQNGYLVVDDARRGEQYLAGIDWSKTRAFALGLTGIFVNLTDKFEQGIVQPEDAEALRTEIAEKLRGLVDPHTSDPAILRVYQAARAYRGPYVENAPDLIVGYASGYRVSWDAAVGKTTRQVFSDNHKAWSGDHCVDPSVVPGILFCNRKIEAERPRLLEIGPTILRMFGVPVPEHMDGQPFGISEQWHPSQPTVPQRQLETAAS
jgi:predicted AlkP superfamily phosphohydrolase/phosphomutase